MMRTGDRSKANQDWWAPLRLQKSDLIHHHLEMAGQKMVAQGMDTQIKTHTQNDTNRGLRLLSV